MRGLLLWRRALLLPCAILQICSIVLRCVAIGFAHKDADGFLVTLFGADLTDADFTGADLTNANLGQCNLTGTIFKDANLSGAIVSGANMDELGDIDGSDWTDVIVRKDVNDKMCAKNPQGVNAVTGNPTAMSLFCN